MGIRYTQFFAGILTFIIVLPLVLYPFLEARAADDIDGLVAGYNCVAGALGFTTASLTSQIANLTSINQVPVNDKESISAVKEMACSQFLQVLKDAAVRAARAVLKKRILDTIVDQTVEWIQNGDLSTGPKFVDNFGDFVNESLQLAAGDVAKEVGLAQLCSPGLGLQLQLNLQRPDFSNKFRCTFDQIVGNMNSFRTNFGDGGWIGYNELLKPQNNRWGLEIMAMSELEKKQAQQKESRNFEVTTGAGFLSTKQCITWNAFSSDGSKLIGTWGADNPIFAGDYNDPNNPPPPDYYTVGSVWRCANVKITTPGGVIAGVTNKAVNANVDYIINSDDLTEYAAALIDAGINRLIKEGVKGIKGMAANKTSSGAAVVSTGGYISSSPALTSLGASSTAAQNDLRYSNTKRGISNQLNAASSSLTKAYADLLVASSTNMNIVSVIVDFQTWCVTNSSVRPNTCAYYNDVYKNNILARSSLISSSLTQIKTLQNKVGLFISRVANINSDTNAQAITSEVISFSAEVDGKIGEVAQLTNTVQTELAQTTSFLQVCKIPTTPLLNCP
ncbi:MAG: hypothetical protein WCW78_01325 [Candidatus Paceibacterota bacterium]|jgi:hypothetical protein